MFNPSPVSGKEAANLPNVTPVTFPEDALVAGSYDLNALSNPIVFNESTIKFAGDSAEFIDRNSAMDVLKPIASLLTTHPETKIIIAGTTASVGSQYECVELSIKRAEACRDILLQLGVLDSQVECVGLGRAETFLRVNDLNPDGTLNAKMAQLNRAIYIFTSDSDAAARVLNE